MTDYRRELLKMDYRRELSGFSFFSRLKGSLVGINKLAEVSLDDLWHHRSVGLIASDHSTFAVDRCVNFFLWFQGF
jgi:hypothetical protein